MRVRTNGKKKLRKLSVFSCLLFLLIWSSAANVVFAQDEEVEETPNYLLKKIKKISGPRRTIAVGDFTAVGSFAAVYGDWDIGGGLASMLTSALIESDRFIVLERTYLSDILTEQELTANALTAGAGVHTGKLSSAQLLVYGAVTVFDTREKGGGFKIGVSRGSALGGLGSQKTEGRIEFDIRVVNTTSGQIVESHRVSKKVTSKGFDLTVGYKGVVLGDNNFVHTPLGEASREALTEAVQLIAQDVQGTPWAGRVVTFEGGEIYINAGSESGIEVGDEFDVERIVKRLTDPETGELLSIRKVQIGMVIVSGVEQRVSFGPYIALNTLQPERSDMVVMTSSR